MLDVEKGLRQECTRAVSVQHVFHGGAARGRKCFIAVAAIMDSMVQLHRKKKEKGEKKRRNARTSKPTGGRHTR